MLHPCFSLLFRITTNFAQSFPLPHNAHFVIKTLGTSKVMESMPSSFFSFTSWSKLSTAVRPAQPMDSVPTRIIIEARQSVDNFQPVWIVILVYYISADIGSVLDILVRNRQCICECELKWIRTYTYLEVGHRKLGASRHLLQKRLPETLVTFKEPRLLVHSGLRCANRTHPSQHPNLPRVALEVMCQNMSQKKTHMFCGAKATQPQHATTYTQHNLHHVTPCSCMVPNWVKTMAQSSTDLSEHRAALSNGLPGIITSRHTMPASSF